MKRVLLASTLTSFLLMGCEKVRIISPEQAALESQMEALKTEDAELQQKLLTLQQVLPPNTNSLQAATLLAAKLEGDNQQITRQLEQALKSSEDLNATVTKLQKNVEALRQQPKP